MSWTLPSYSLQPAWHYYSLALSLALWLDLSLRLSLSGSLPLCFWLSVQFSEINNKTKFQIHQIHEMLHLYSSEHCVGIVQLKLKETTFYPLNVTDLANLFHCPSDVSWGPTRRASDGRAGTQGGTCKYNMSVQFLIHHPFKQDYKTIYRESIKHFLVGRFWHIKHESWIHSLRGDVVEGDSIVAQSTKALVLVVKSLTIKHQRWM